MLILDMTTAYKTFLPSAPIFTSNSNGYSCLQLQNLHSFESYVRNLGLAPEDGEQKHGLYSGTELLTQPLRHDSSGKSQGSSGAAQCTKKDRKMCCCDCVKRRCRSQVLWWPGEAVMTWNAVKRLQFLPSCLL